MWRIKFKEAFRFNAGVSDPLKKKIFAKKNKKMEEKILYNFFCHEFTNKPFPVHENIANDMLNLNL